MPAMGPAVPLPVSVQPEHGEALRITPATPVVAGPGAGEVAVLFAGVLGASGATGSGVPDSGVPGSGVPGSGVPGSGPPGGISLELTRRHDDTLGDEGYTMECTAAGVSIRANRPAGLFYGTQTLRQLMTRSAAGGDRPMWTIGAGRVVDRPRYAYRGVMLDVARRFFPVGDVKRLIDLAALHKCNHLHMHLTDDQGWRIAIDGWPRLATYGGGTEVGGGSGGHYTAAQYREIVEYAARRFVTVVPEVDLPGHTNAALASYPELTCDGAAPPRYTGIDVGFSALCVDKEETYHFLDDVFGQLARLTDGEYLHLGGDEAKTLTPQAYGVILARAQAIVARHGKTAIGWHEVAAADPPPSTVVQYWGVARQVPEVTAFCAKGGRVIMSPANHTYLDMKYDAYSPVGQSWAGFLSVEAAYRWDPVSHLAGVGPDRVLGVEAPLWTETVRGVDDLDYLAFPRLAAIAEVAWSQPARRDWPEFRTRLGGMAPLWRELGVGFYPSPEIAWIGPRAGSPDDRR